MADITVILPTWNRRHVLERTWHAMAPLAEQYRFILVDDGSDDGTGDFMRSKGVEVVRHGWRRGAPAGRNTGLKLATTPWVLFAEDDVLMPEDYGERLLAAAARLPRCAAVGGRLFGSTSWELPESMPADGKEPVLDPVWLRGCFDGPLPWPRPLPSIHACALVDRRAILAVGGYDATMVNSAFREESDAYARLWRAGHGVWLTPDTWAVHVAHTLGGGARGRAGLGAKLRNRINYAHNNDRYVARHFDLWKPWGAPGGPGMASLRWWWRIAKMSLAAVRSR